MNRSVIYRVLSRAHFKPFCRSNISQFPVNDDLYNFSDEQKHFRKTLQSFVSSEVYPIANTTDVMDNISDMRSLWKKFGAMGLLGVTAPEKYGGINHGYLSHCVAMEEISRASGSIGLSYGAHSNLCVNQLVRHASEDQAQRYLPGVSSVIHKFRCYILMG
ncbi:hypothetical protein EG68_11223, partial [Paragonimus skrjabini miyazakii]